MTTTNYPDGLTSYGVPLIGSISGIPLTGTWYFVDAVSGNDGNTGTTPGSAFSTLPVAYAACTEGQNDTVVLVGRPTTAASTTGTFRLSSTLSWAKSATHLIGECAPSMVSQRARISTATGATTNVNPLVNVTGIGCIFMNFSLFQGVGEANLEEQLWQDAGQRNYYGNVAFGGIGGAAGGPADADSYSLKLYGAQENLFEHCYFGVDTRSRSAANTNILIRKNASNVASTRNIFRNCITAMYATATSPTFINSNESGGVDRFNMFQSCTFINSGTSTLVAGVAFHATQGGVTVMDNCTMTGATDWTASDTAVVRITGAVPNGTTSGLAVSANTA